MPELFTTGATYWKKTEDFVSASSPFPSSSASVNVIVLLINAGFALPFESNKSVKVMIRVSLLRFIKGLRAREIWIVKATASVFCLLISPYVGS